MSEWRSDGRVFEPVLEVLVAREGDGRVRLRAPRVGLWRGAPRPGSVITSGTPIGELEILSVLHRLRVPSGVSGVVQGEARGSRVARIPVEYGDDLLVLDPHVGAAAEQAAERDVQEAADEGGPVLRSPSSGRFYAKPSPEKPAFVGAGDVVRAGSTVGLLEVMKTFSRITYGGESLPEQAKVVEVVPSDGDDLDEGDVILRLEPVT